METKPEDAVLTLKYLAGEPNRLPDTDQEVNCSPEAINAGTEVEMLSICKHGDTQTAKARVVAPGETL